jgi:hypothetical protein
VTVPLTVTLNVPVALVPAEKIALPLVPAFVCHVPVAALPAEAALQLEVVFWSQVPGAVVPPLEPPVLLLVSQ